VKTIKTDIATIEVQPQEDGALIQITSANGASQIMLSHDECAQMASTLGAIVLKKVRGDKRARTIAFAELRLGQNFRFAGRDDVCLRTDGDSRWHNYTNPDGTPGHTSANARVVVVK